MYIVVFVHLYLDGTTTESNVSSSTVSIMKRKTNAEQPVKIDCSSELLFLL